VAVDGAGNVVESDGLSDRVRVVADETPIRVGPGPKSRKRYLLVACTNLLTYYFPGDRDTGTFQAFVFPGMDGAVSDYRQRHGGSTSIWLDADLFAWSIP
jgi:hypothetical protein